MATYAIGDIQGCFASFIALLDKLNFDQQKDTLWLAGDLVHRGGESLKTLEYIYSIRHSLITVLGNHDLHLIAAYYGQKKLKPDSDLHQILHSKHSEKLITWLQQQPLLYQHNDYLLAHAGVPHNWSTDQAIHYAKEVESILRSNKKIEFLSEMYGDTPAIWSEHLAGMPRLRCITNYLTRMRYIDNQTHALNFTCKSHPQDAPKNLTPWFLKTHSSHKRKIIFGHWAALNGETHREDIIALDTGCVWGGRLSAYNIHTYEIISVAKH